MLQMLDDRMTNWLRAFLTRNAAIAGTVHVVRDDQLAIAAAINIPPKVQEITAVIPKGKGMAGIAWERAAPIQTCNLKDDHSGNVRPGAKAVDAQAAVAIPVRASDGAIWGVVGIAWSDQRELSDAELTSLAKDAATVIPTI